MKAEGHPMTDTPDAPATMDGLNALVRQLREFEHAHELDEAEDCALAIDAYARRLAAPVQPQKHEANSIHLGLPSGLHGQELPLEPVAWATTYRGELTRLFAAQGLAEEYRREMNEEYGPEGDRQVVPLYAAAPPSGLHESAQAVEPGWKLLKDTTAAERSWPFDPEQGGIYYFLCSHCLREFTTHERRSLCRVCAAASPPPGSVDTAAAPEGKQ